MPISQLLAALAIAAGSAGAAWMFQDARYGERIAEVISHYADVRLQAEIDARAKEKILTTRVKKAQDYAVKSKQAQEAADAVTSTLRNELRDTNAAALLVSRTSPAACSKYATTLSTVFNECSAEVEGLEKKASGHALDALTLQMSWPAFTPAP